MQGVREGRRAVRVDFAPSPARAAAGVTITSVRERVAAVAEIVKVVPLSVPAAEGTPPGLSFSLVCLVPGSVDELAAAAETTPDRVLDVPVELPAEEPGLEAEEVGPSERGGWVRVEVSRLDDALEKLSALVIGRSRVGRAVAALGARGADVRELAGLLAENGRQLRELRGSIMRARLVSMAELLERVPLIVRGMTRGGDKRVRLELDAGRAELDKAVAERAFPALVHLVRNAVDHAIEPAAERARLGKPEEGRLRVACATRGGMLEVRIADDGRGVDREAVARKAGAPVPETDEALLALLTRPGLSTLERATSFSGRGMGMDIVKRILVDQLGGALELETTPGRGTTFAAWVPLSITIVDALSFTCGPEAFVVPVAAVEEILDLEGATLRAPPGGDVRLLARRDETVPLFDLGRVLGLPEAPRKKALLVRRHGRPLGFAVDRLLGKQEVVVRPLEDPLVHTPGVPAATDLGDGRPTLVLDLVALGGALSAADARP